MIVSEGGKRFLASLTGTEITRSHLKEFPKVRAFVAKSNKRKTKSTEDDNGAEVPLTPMDQISEALDQIEGELARDIIEQLTSAPPAFVERVVIDLLIAMGYGGGDKSQGRVRGKAGDNGIDGVIDQGQLGLDGVKFRPSAMLRTMQ